MDINIKEYKDFVNNINSDAIESLDNDYTSCWMFAYYIHCKYGFPMQNYNNIYKIQGATTFNFDENGIYSYSMDCYTESHYFVLFVNNDDIIMFATYGGQENIIKIKYNKNEFIDLFNDLMAEENNKKKIAKYRKLFGIKKVYFDTLNMSEFTLNYTFKKIENLIL